MALDRYAARRHPAPTDTLGDWLDRLNALGFDTHLEIRQTDYVWRCTLSRDGNRYEGTAPDMKDAIIAALDRVFSDPAFAPPPKAIQ